MIKFIKIKFPDGSYGVISQIPLSESEADKILEALNR